LHGEKCLRNNEGDTVSDVFTEKREKMEKMDMKALVKFDLGIKGMEIREVPKPVPKDGELLVKVLAAGICGSDIHARHDQREVRMPVTLGHEFVGEIVETKGDVGNFKPGDWIVTLPACYSCGECWLCKQGLVTLCARRASIGSHVNGAMAEYVVVPAKYSFRIPDDAGDKVAYALTEPMGCVVRGVYERIDVKLGDIAVVSGPGTIGLFAVALLKSRNAYVIAFGLPQDSHRLELALALGADAVADSWEKLREEVFKVNPKGADIAVEAAGVGGSLDTCVKILRAQGTLLQLGNFGKQVQFNMDMAFFKELQIITSNSTAYSTWLIALKLLKENKVSLEPLLSLRLPLEEWRKGFEAAENKQAYKVVLLM
jgi:threonine dehydrogenase-like Zn-dependent dehydrogenase